MDGGSGSGGSHSREYCLRWNNHQPNFVTFLSSVLHKESFTDVTLVSSEGSRIQAHRLVLSACSPYFEVLRTSMFIPLVHPLCCAAPMLPPCWYQSQFNGVDRLDVDWFLFIHCFIAHCCLCCGRVCSRIIHASIQW